MIQVGVVGDPEAAYFAAKKGFVVLSLEPEMEREVKRAGGTFLLFGGEEADIKIKFANEVEAALAMVNSADILIINNSKFADLVKAIADARSKPYVIGSGKEAVDKAVEKLVRFNLFGKK